MEPSEIIPILRKSSKPLETASTTTEQIKVIQEFLDERGKLYYHKKRRKDWVPVEHRITQTDSRDAEPANFYNKLRKSWGSNHITIQPLGIFNWKPAYSYYSSLVNKIPIPKQFQIGIYSLFLIELGHYFIKELQERILNQHKSVILHKYRLIHKEAKKNSEKKILVKTGKYVESMKLSFGVKKVTLTVEHEKHEESDDLTYLQLSRILEFGTPTSPAYSHWTKLKNFFDGGESKKFMKSFLSMYLDVDKKLLT